VVTSAPVPTLAVVLAPKENRGLAAPAPAFFATGFFFATGLAATGLGLVVPLPYMLLTAAFLGCGFAGSFLPKNATVLGVAAGARQGSHTHTPREALDWQNFCDFLSILFVFVFHRAHLDYFDGMHWIWVLCSCGTVPRVAVVARG
jgi:hypothetical protein